MLQLRPSTDCASLVAQLVKNLPAKRETWVQFLDWDDSPGEEHSIFLPGEFPWTEEPAGYSPWGRKESGTTERVSTAQQINKNITKKKSIVSIVNNEHPQIQQYR